MKAVSCLSLSAIVGLTIVSGICVQDAGAQTARGRARPGGRTKGRSAARGTESLKIRKIEGLDKQCAVKSPEYRTNIGRSVKPAEKWVQVTVTYDTTPEWIDELTFQYFVMSMKVTATPTLQGATFTGWTGTNESDSLDASNVLNVVMSSAREITASFTGGVKTVTSQGTPLTWLQKFGLDEADDTLDTDGDGLLTWEEYIVGTHPTNKESVFQVLGQGSMAGSNYVMFYGGETNSDVVIPFGMYRSTNLVGGWGSPYVTNIDRANAVDGTNIWWDTSLPSDTVPVFYLPFVTWTN